MRKQTLKSLRKFISLILRHDPNSFGVVLTKDGYADLKDLLEVVRRNPRFRKISKDEVLYVIKNDEKGRFEIKQMGDKILVRALYGHSKNLDVQIDYQLADKEEVRYLYHGTQEENLDSILSEGLKPRGRKYVHLSTTIKDAEVVAKRRQGRPVILIVDAKKMIENGYKIYKATRRVYLTDYVPPKYIVKVLKR